MNFELYTGKYVPAVKGKRGQGDNGGDEGK